MSKEMYLKFAYESLRGWIKELNTNKHGFAHMAEDAINLLKEQIESKKRGLI